MERLGVRPSKLKVYHSINTERSIPANRRVYNVPLDDTLMLVADDDLLPDLALPDELLATESCLKIPENKNKERVCGQPISMRW